MDAPRPLSSTDDPEVKDSLIAYDRLSQAIEVHSEWESLEDVLADLSTLSELEAQLDATDEKTDEAHRRLDEVEAKTDAAHRRADHTRDQAEANREMLKTLFGVDARRGATDSVYEEFFPTPTDGRAKVKMARRRALMQWLVRRADEDNEALARLYKKKVAGRSPKEDARTALRAADLEPPVPFTIERDLKALADVVPGCVWRQDGEKGQNRKALMFSAKKFMAEWDGYPDE